jgi:hypothetical protein
MLLSNVKKSKGEEKGGESGSQKLFCSFVGIYEGNKNPIRKSHFNMTIN